MPTNSAIWSDYYTKFNRYFSPDSVRQGCEPRVLLHPTAAEDAIVLVHGLTDSPHFMSAIASYFHDELGYDVYMPLLHCHGLLDPNDMKGVSTDEWKANVAHAVEAATRSNRVSIGGLSTGGTLSFYTAATNSRVNGALYLFSAALDVTFDATDTWKVWLLQIPPLLRALLESKTPLVGRNPFRYDRMDFDGAAELVKLIEHTDGLLATFRGNGGFPLPVFAAHSESDTTADIDGIRRLQTVCAPELCEPYFIPAASGVSHASLVLQHPVAALDDAEVLETANPVFDDMMKRVGDFARRHGTHRRLTA